MEQAIAIPKELVLEHEILERVRSKGKQELEKLHTLYYSDTETKLEQLAVWLVEASEELASEIIGGYSDEVAVVAGCVVVASVTHDGAPSLEIFDTSFALRWHDAVIDYLTDPELEPEMMNMVYAVNESRPNE